ncbi:junctional adhesion molecule-like isoform X4 [Myotis daubentonii]|uniref:junctional adhesion molecule-like isoform X4 n=1 Tax=Myotis daubentonii TaxID=98922 RepID=UPI002873DE4D|nr:junctional adhesion molecule-like isoform X4 [Myotis daubentonii]
MGGGFGKSVHTVLTLEIKVDAHVRGYVGEKIRLKCIFKSTSSVTDKLTIDWTYRAPSSSRTESIFHYQSFQYPSTAGTFRDRISWVGDVYKGDASISISNPTTRDNGTFSCAVKNPPDVHHNIPTTELTVTERGPPLPAPPAGFGTMLSSVALLSILVFVPSAVVVALLLVRMVRKSAGLRKRSKSGYKKSSIEVSDELKMESGVLCLLRLTLRPVLLGYFLGLNDLIVSSLELTVHAGEPALLGCVFQSVEGKRVTKVDWTFSPREHAQVEYVLYYYANLSVPVGRFQTRARLAGALSHNNGSLLLQDVQEADQGTYTCEIRLELESRVFKTEVALHVLPEEPRELTVHVGDSAPMGCAFQSTEEKLMTKVDWTFSPGKHAKEEVMLRYYPTRGPGGYSQSGGRFRSRVALAGDTARNEGSVLLQEARESDTGSYTCSIHLGDLTFRKTFALHVIPEEPRALVTTVARSPEVLGSNHLVIIVGIVCATVLLLPVLILTARRIHGSKSSGTSTALVKSLEDRDKAPPEKHVYSSINTWEVTKEEEPSDRSEATYMTMHPVWPSALNYPPEKKWAEGVPQTGQGF